MKTKLSNRWISKLMALCLAVVMTLSMSMTVFAAISPSTTGTITVNGLDEGTVVTAYKETTADTFKSFWHDMAAAIKDGTINMAGTESDPVAKEADSVTFTDMAMGEYLLTANGGVKVYRPTTAILLPKYVEGDGWSLENASANMKGEKPTIGKEGSTEDGDTTVAIGDVVNYKLTVVVPDYPEEAKAARMEVADTLSSGLTYNNDVKVYSDENLENEVTSGAATYTITEDPATYTFQLVFAKDYILNNGGKTFYVAYSATVNENAFDTDALGNKAFLGYNNDPYEDSSFHPDQGETEEDVYTYGIKILKENEAGTENLSGAEFKLYENDTTGNPLKFVGASGVYTYTKVSGDDTLTVAGDGSLQIQGLDEGTYVLKETKAPDGYVLPNGEITIQITDDKKTDGGEGADGTIDAVNVSQSGSASYDDEAVNKNVISFNVQNTSSADAGFQLPTTGGMGTMIFTIAGILLMGGAVALIVVAARKKRG